MDEAPLLQVLDNFVPAELHHEVWSACMAPRWYFGNRSTDVQSSRAFWKMDLDGIAAIDRVWEHARSQCEGLARRPLRVVRQYANGHTYGLGGRPHFDDTRPGTFTLLYYPMPAWRPEWEGETLFFNAEGHIAAGIALAPNRAVFFDSRISHAGRAPSRDCPELRVSVAWKLEGV